MAKAEISPDQRPRFCDDDYAYLRLLVSRYCPPAVPRHLRNRFSAIWPMERAVMVYLMRVELEWGRNDIAARLKMWPRAVTLHVTLIEDLRSQMPWIEKISEYLRDYRRGLL